MVTLKDIDRVKCSGKNQAWQGQGAGLSKVAFPLKLNINYTEYFDQYADL